MGHEFDFLPVGEGSKSGDAIALRWGDDLINAPTEQQVAVIDGGFLKSGEKLLEFIETRYDTHRIDFVVSTHPDRDHISGLRYVVENADVGELWMHLPADHAPEVEAVRSGAFVRRAFSETVARSFDDAFELEEIAISKGVTIREPFTGLATPDGVLTIVGPTEVYYEECLSSMMADDTSIATVVTAAARGILRWVGETWSDETLSDYGETSPSNNSSAITLFRHPSGNGLFTGDAGIPALSHAIEQLQLDGFGPGELKFLQVPHHGSRRNVGTNVLNALLGGLVNEGEVVGVAFVSAAPEGEPKHPSLRVSNAFQRRGFPVHATQGSFLNHSEGTPDRGWPKSVPLPFYPDVEEEEEEDG